MVKWRSFRSIIFTEILYIPDVMPLTCFLDIVGCVPEKMASKYTSLLPFLRNLFTTSTKEDIKDTAAVIYAIITVHTTDKASIDKEIREFVVQGRDNKTLETQCGYLTAFANMCERCVVLGKRGKFGGKGFNATNWEPYQDGAACLGKNVPILLNTVLLERRYLEQTNNYFLVYLVYHSIVVGY